MGLADVAFSMYRNGFTAYLGGNPLSLGFLTDRGVAAAKTGRIDTRDVRELAYGIAAVSVSAVWIRDKVQDHWDLACLSTVRRLHRSKTQHKVRTDGGW